MAGSKADEAGRIGSRVGEIGFLRAIAQGVLIGIASELSSVFLSPKVRERETNVPITFPSSSDFTSTSAFTPLHPLVC